MSLSMPHRSKQRSGTGTHSMVLGEVVHNAKYFFAWKDGILIGTYNYNTLGEATASLASGKAPKTTTVRQSA
jgi:hypothetical protein